MDRTVDMRARRNEFIGQLAQLAAEMENDGPGRRVDWVGPQNSKEQFHGTQYTVRAGKIIFKAYQSGEFHGNGIVCKILDQLSGSDPTDWSYIQGFESICWQWYGDRFDDRRKELGELKAYAYVIRLLMGELEKENMD